MCPLYEDGEDPSQPFCLHQCFSGYTVFTQNLQAGATMIYWDLISHYQMFCYIYKIQDIIDMLGLEVEG